MESQKRWINLECPRLTPSPLWPQVTFLTSPVVNQFNSSSEDRYLLRELMHLLLPGVSPELQTHANSLLCIPTWRCPTWSAQNSLLFPSQLAHPLVLLILASRPSILLISQARPAGCLRQSRLPTSRDGQVLSPASWSLLCPSLLPLLMPLLYIRSSLICSLDCWRLSWLVLLPLALFCLSWAFTLLLEGS